MQESLHIMERNAAFLHGKGDFAMSRLKTVACLLAMAALAPLLLGLRSALPTDRQALIEEKYGGWSGVLRLWIFEGWTPGSGGFASWLNGCVAAFEKAHPGVYAQPEYVDADTLRGWNDGTLPPPNLLLFPPGLLDAPRGLTPLETPPSLRPGLRRKGDWAGVCYALPVAMGGCLTLRADIDGPCVAPPDGDFRLTAAALACLPDEEEDDGEGVSLPGLDLGLPAFASAQPEWTLREDAWKAFANGEAAALLATPREVRRLEALAEQGKGPNWRVDRVSRFTDQLLFAATPAQGGEQQALAEAFVQWLLGDDSQGGLHRAGAFSVTEGPSGYAAGDSLTTVEAFLRRDGLLAPPAFGTQWREAVSDIVREYWDGDGDKGDLMENLREALG